MSTENLILWDSEMVLKGHMEYVCTLQKFKWTSKLTVDKLKEQSSSS